MDVSKQTRQTIGEVASTRSERECPVCGSMDLAPFVDVLDIPVHVGHLWPTAEQARCAPTGDIKAAFCRGCGYVWNMAFDPSKVTYAPGYDHSLHHSVYYQSFIDALALELIKRYDLHGKTIVEIGCGNGDFLRTIFRLGDNRGIGFDPSVEPADRGDDGERVTFIQDFYSERYADDGADFICSRHVLVQLPEPREFMSMIRRAIGDRPKTVVYIEVQDVQCMLRDLTIWNFEYL